MSYVKTTWQTGDIVTAEKLNNAEQGIAQNAHDIEDLSADTTYLKNTLSEYESIFTGDIDDSVQN